MIIQRKSQPNFILIDAEQFQNIKWVRIKCADFDKEELVNIDKFIAKGGER